MYDKSHNNYTGNASDGYKKPMDSAGVGSGLSSQETMEVKDMESVTMNQRPEGNTTDVKGFKIGVL